MSLSAQRKKRKRNGTREGPVIKVGWQASTAAAARFSDREGRGDLHRADDFMPSAASRPRLRSGARFGPPFWLLPDHKALCARHTACWPLLLRALGKLPHPHDDLDGGHGCASERTTGLVQIGNKPRRGPYFDRRAQIPSPAYRRLEALLKCPRSRSVSLCCFCDDLSDEVGTSVPGDDESERSLCMRICQLRRDFAGIDSELEAGCIWCELLVVLINCEAAVSSSDGQVIRRQTA